VPSPGPTTNPEGGSPFQDYYAFTWGDALFVVLNVSTYTPTCHLLDFDPGLPDDWTLGQAQLDWLRRTLASAQSKWKFVLIHHPVGGNAGNDVNSAYGRGGGRAAHVGEQEIVHELMQQFGVQIFFYGHDHVFTDMLVDGIRYTLPGSAGAIWMFQEVETGYNTFWPDSGWGRVDVTPDAVHVQMLAVGGKLLFDYTLP
jgi:3',5'-cyclic AMP phosphodiesterase CpdA